MSEILRVWDHRLRRIVAMKMLPPGHGGRPGSEPQRRLVSRLMDEAHITAQLQHPSILSVHDLGVDPAGRLFFTMPLVKGAHFGEVIDLVHEQKEGWTLPRALAVIQRVCEAVAYAHSKGVVHRDLKPSNIMVGRFGETFVLDWGLARTLDPEPSTEGPTFSSVDASIEVDSVRRRLRNDTPTSSILTLDGAVVGTPAYMAPEQAQGRMEEVGVRSDVYSVGAILYQLLTGRRPYQKSGTTPSAEVLIEWVRTGPPDPVERIAPSVPSELTATCEKAMARDPRDRYADCLELADDIQAYLEGRVVRAYEAGAFAELRKWVRRNRGHALALSLGLLGVFGGLLGILAVEARNRRRSEDKERVISAAHRELAVARKESEARLDQLRREAYFNHIARAQRALEDGEPASLLQSLEKCETDLRNWEWAYLDRLAHPAVRTYEGMERQVTTLAFSRDAGLVAATGWDHRIHVWDLSTGELVGRIPVDSLVINLAFDPGGTRLAAAGDYGIRLHELPTGSTLWRVDHGIGSMRDLAFSPAGDLLIASFMGGGTRIWSTDSGKEVGALPGSSPSSTRRFTRPNLGEEPRSIAVSARSDRLAIAEGVGTIVLGELSTLAEVGRIELGEEILDVDFRSEDDHLAALVRDAEGQRISVRIVDPESAVAQTLLTREYRREGRGWLSPDGSKAALLCDATLAFQDTRGGPVTEMMMGGMTPPHALAWVDANRVIVSDRAEVRLLEVVDPVHRVLEATGDATRCVNVAPDGSTVAAVGSDDLIQLWNLDTRDEPRAFRTDQGRTAVAFSPDGTKMASVGSDGSLALWSSADGRSLGRWAVSSSLLETVVFCPGGKMVATAGEAGVGLWNLEDGSGHVNGELSSVTHVAVDPAGRRLATASDQAILAVWDAETLELLNHQVIPRRRFGWTAGFSSDGRRIVYATDADQVIVVDSETLEPVLECESSATESSGKQTGTFKTIFSPDGERILATWQTGRHRIFDARTGRHVLSLDTRRHGSYGSLDFSADGMVLAIAGPGRTVDVWDLRR